MQKFYSTQVNPRIEIFIIALWFYRDSQYLNQPSQVEHREEVNRSRFIQRARYAFFYFSIIEFNKLFKISHNNYYNFQKFFAEIKKNNEVCSIIGNDQITQWEEDLERLSNVTKKIETLRDKFYAHTDQPLDNKLSEVTPDFEEIEQLINKGKDILQEVTRRLKNTDYVFEYPGTMTARSILERMVELRIYRNNDFED